MAGRFSLTIRLLWALDRPQKSRSHSVVVGVWRLITPREELNDGVKIGVKPFSVDEEILDWDEISFRKKSSWEDFQPLKEGIFSEYSFEIYNSL